MSRYTVIIEARYGMDVEVEADSEADACEKAEEAAEEIISAVPWFIGLGGGEWRLPDGEPPSAVMAIRIGEQG